MSRDVELIEKLKNLRIRSKRIGNAASDGYNVSFFRAASDGYNSYYGCLYRTDVNHMFNNDYRHVTMFPEFDIKSRWKSSVSGFLYSDELKILSRLHHENFMPFIGYCDEKDVFLQKGVDDYDGGDKVLLVYEPRSFYGNLAEYLRKVERSSIFTEHCHYHEGDHSWAERLKICIGIAKGLNYLHSGVEGVGRVIHHDLQSKNIMLTHVMKPIIMGFYHSVIVPENQLHTQVNSHERHEHHPDPIYHEIGLLDTTTDVYSYGILMFEILMRMVANEEKVIGDYKPQRLINIVRRYDNKPEQLIDPVLRGQIDPRSFQMFIDVAYRCISLNLKDRPTINEVVKMLMKALKIHNQRSPLEIAKAQSIPREKIDLTEKIAVGSNTFYRGDLYHHSWQKGRPVAVKSFKSYQSFKGELEIVSRLQHENIIRFIGYSIKDNEEILVYEYADNGSLSTYLHSLTWAQRLKICIGAAKGLKYLHTGLGEYESVIHGEFSSKKILITKDLKAKICGLGSSFLVPRNHPDTKVYEKPVGGQEMDPVYRESCIPKVESNVYSLGVVLFEILTGKLVDTKCDVDEELSLMALVRRHYGDGFDEFIAPRIRDEIDVRSLHIFKEIAYRCISYQIKRRPSMNKIIKRLEDALHIQNHIAASTESQRSMLEDFFIPLSAIQFDIGVKGQEIKLGSGGFGKVYKGQLLEQRQKRTVAIKRLDSNRREDTFHNELNMIFRLSHDNIIPFIGYCDEGKEKYIVYEYASNSSLDYHLEDGRKRRELTWEHRLKICLGAARGLDYLHSDLGEENRIIHRDVKSGNILLDRNFEAKVCDFGLSKSGPINQPHTQVYTNAAGTDCYIDPVYHEGGILRKESDVYSFGVVMFELLSGLLAYKSRKLEGDERKPLLNIVRQYYASKPELLIDPVIIDKIDRRSFNVFREAAFQCISFNSKERPTMEAIADRVEEALELQVSSFNSKERPTMKPWNF